jgi:hypothetical protein
MADDKTSVFERHAQTILTGIVAGLIGWVGISVSQQATSIALLQQSLDQLQRKVEDFTSEPRFTKNDFHVMISPVVGELSSIKINQSYLEKRVSDLEDDIYVEYVKPSKKLD